MTEARIEEKGQSLVEFLLMLPILFGFVFVLVRVNTVIQSAIVDQQYARAQVLFLTFNNGYYPEVIRQTQLNVNNHNRFTLGVSQNAPGGSASSYDAQYVPSATTYVISRTGRTIASDGQQGYPFDINDPSGPTKFPRDQVRVRNTASICMPSVYINPSGPLQPGGTPILDQNGSYSTTTGTNGFKVLNYPQELSSSAAYAYCGSGSMPFEGEL